MTKKRKTYYLEESTIRQVKHYARELNLSENDAFEKSIRVFEELYYQATNYITVPLEYKPILLESVDNLIYASRHAIETLPPDEEWTEQAYHSINQRIELLLKVRKFFLNEKR
ncbi:MAG TPA: hypothetical protein VJ824_16860 [Bacillota bacterium]|nr:hypothetical protein [Bacillota bacterium]